MLVIEPSTVYFIEQLDAVHVFLERCILFSFLMVIFNIVGKLLMDVIIHKSNDSLMPSVSKQLNYIDANTKQASEHAKVISNILDPNAQIMSRLEKSLNNKNSSLMFTNVEIKTELPVTNVSNEDKEKLLETNTLLVNTITSCNRSLKEFEVLYNEFKLHSSTLLSNTIINKVCLLILVVAVLLQVALPTKDTAYKMLYTSYITVNDDGDINRDTVKFTIDQITKNLLDLQ